MKKFLEKGWAKFEAEADLLGWVEEAHSAALKAVADPDNEQWLVCEGTWFVGVDALPNDATGKIGGVSRPSGGAFGLAQVLYGELPFHAGQVSVIYPGYPRPRAGETEAAFGYRLRRDAAHVDGILAVGEARRRHLLERHAYILGVALADCDAGASPLSLWQGSHLLMRAAFEDVLCDASYEHWGDVDVTEIYQATRRTIFEDCERLTVPLKRGESYLIHRHMLHGVSPWQDGAKAPSEGRMIAYFRPEWQEMSDNWLTAP